MLEAQLYTAAAEEKGSYALPGEFDGRVNQAVLYHAVRAYRNNQRQGTASTKTRAEVSGGGRKPWRQKGTGRARQGTTRAPHWPGGGVAFGPRPRSYQTDLPRKVKQLARQSALNARAGESALYVIESLAFDAPKTKQLAGLLAKLGLETQKVLVLTAEHRPAVYLSGRNIPDVQVMRYAEASAYEILWSNAVVIEEAALGGHAVAGSAPKRAAKKPAAAKRKATGRASTRTSAKPTKAAKSAAKRSSKKATKSTRKGGGDA
ncbi:MAG: 50S ribosomal protein L4 [Gemmatimonadales bacterium]|nr:50S ribosomal protein L4 [Gemmatimonadales bacterium]